MATKAVRKDKYIDYALGEIVNKDNGNRKDDYIEVRVSVRVRVKVSISVRVTVTVWVMVRVSVRVKVTVSVRLRVSVRVRVMPSEISSTRITATERTTISRLG